jgi:hypothetical protein
VSLKRLIERAMLSARAAPFGVAVEAGADGQSFSYARILRDRHQFRGELPGDRRRADR